MNMTVKVILGLTLSAGGAAGVILADRAGWLSRVPGVGSGAVAAATCEHDLIAGSCPFCNEALIDEMGWCGGHGVPEAYCTRCNDYLIPAFKAVNDWCAEHGLPESQCMICNPELANAKPVAPAASPAVINTPENLDVELVANSDIPRWNRDPDVTCTRTETLVVFSSSEIADRVGLQYDTVRAEDVVRSLEVNGQIELNANRSVRVSSRAAGVLDETLVDLGNEVRRGDPIAIVDAVEVAQAKSELLSARALVSLWERNHQREQDLLAKGISTERQAIEAETHLTESRIAKDAAEQRLRNLGLTDEEITRVVAENDCSPRLTITAPRDGVVIERFAWAGELVGSNEPLFVISDLASMWALLDISESDIGLISVDQSVAFRVDGLRGENFGGRITWISPRVDSQTRTLRARAELRNPSGLLRADMFGRAEISITNREPVKVVPKTAVQWEGCCNVVFVQKNPAVYEPRKVRLGFEIGDHYALLDGVKPGETVVTDGSFLLKTEIMKGSIGAGCCPEPGV